MDTEEEEAWDQECQKTRNSLSAYFALVDETPL